MSKVSWGKPAIYVKDLDTEGAKWQILPDAAEGTVSLETTKGDKTEAKLEGGENEDVKYNRNTYALNVGIRAVKGRVKPIADNNGIVNHNYAVALVPEDAACPGLYIKTSKPSLEDTFTATDGGQWNYAFDALKDAEDPDSKQVAWGVVTATSTTGGYNLTFLAEGESEAVSI